MNPPLRRIACLLGVLALVVLLAFIPQPAPVTAQAAKAEFKLKLMGINRTLDPWKLYEEWAQTVEKRTNGRVQFELTSLPELGLGGAETLRVLKTGVVDVTETYGGYVAGELPLVEILEMPGIFPDPQTAKKAILAWKPHRGQAPRPEGQCRAAGHGGLSRPGVLQQEGRAQAGRLQGAEDARAQRGAGLAGGRAGRRAPHHRLRRGLHRPGARHAGRGDQRHQARVRPALVRGVQVPGRPHLDAAARGPGHQQEHLEAAAAGHPEDHEGRGRDDRRGQGLRG